MKRKEALIFQLGANMMTLIGVIYLNWSVFALIYLYWIETFLFITANSIKILATQGGKEPAPHCRMAFRYFRFNAGLLLFYLMFIVFFIGFMVAEKQEGTHFSTYLFFREPSFAAGVISFFILKMTELVVIYFLSGQYKKAKPEMFNSFFNMRLILIHVVIVLGVFTFIFLSTKLNNYYGIIGFASVFVAVKCIIDFVGIFYIGKKQKEDNTIPFI